MMDDSQPEAIPDLSRPALEVAPFFQCVGHAIPEPRKGFDGMGLRLSWRLDRDFGGTGTSHLSSHTVPLTASGNRHRSAASGSSPC